MTVLELTRDMAEKKALFDLQLMCWRNKTRLAATRRDTLGRFSR